MKTSGEYSVRDAVQGLLIEESLVSGWLEQWEREKNLILQGPKGVGKTFFATRLAHALLKGEQADRIEKVIFHAAYEYESFVQRALQNEGGRREVENGIFYDFCEKARTSTKAHVFIIDEIDRGDVLTIFGELFSLIARDKRSKNSAVRLRFGSTAFFVPENVYIIGTMNSGTISPPGSIDVLRSRFHFIDLCETEPDRITT